MARPLSPPTSGLVLYDQLIFWPKVGRLYAAVKVSHLTPFRKEEKERMSSAGTDNIRVQCLAPNQARLWFGES